MSGLVRNTSQDPEYEGLPYHEKKFHKTHFGAVKEFRGNERVKVKTADGWTWCNLQVAIEEGYEILPQKPKNGRKGAEVTNGFSRLESSSKHS